MKVTAALASLSVTLLPLVSAASVSVTFDPFYDNPNGPLSAVACSGTHGLIIHGPAFGSLPGFPHIGGAAAVEGFNSANCGTCWQLTFPSGGVTRSVNILVIDHAAGFNIAEAAMNDLTGGLAEQLGRIEANATQVASSLCGL